MEDERISRVSFDDKIKNLKGTFAAEGMNVSDESVCRLRKLSFGEQSCSELIEEIKQKYVRK